MRRRSIFRSGLRCGVRRRLWPRSLLTTVLAALTGDVWIEVAFVLVKGVGAVVDAGLNRRPSLSLSRIAVLVAHVIAASGSGPVLLHGIGRTVANVVVVAAAVLINSRIAAIDVAVDDFVVYAGAILSGRPTARPAIVSVVSRPVTAGTAPPVDAHVVFLNVVVPHVPVDRVVAIEVVDVHLAIDDRSIDGDIVVAVVDVNAV